MPEHFIFTIVEFTIPYIFKTGFVKFSTQGIFVPHPQMMCIAEKFAVICLASIGDEQEKEVVSNSLINTGHQLINITFEQMGNFAGNMLAIKTNDDKNILALSQSSFYSLTQNQKEVIEKSCDLVPLAITTIETIGGGSARCMIAEIFLPQAL